MQVKKDTIRRRLLEAAEEEFRERGFQNAKIRNIATTANVTLGNTYNYFRNKDALFVAVLSPTTTAIDQFLQYSANEGRIIFPGFDLLKKHLAMVIDFIDTHRGNLQLLFFQSAGSSLANFRDEVIDRYTRMGLEKLRTGRSDGPVVSEFTFHNVCSFWVNFISEIIMHDIDKAHIHQYFTEFLNYNQAGWDALIADKS